MIGIITYDTPHRKTQDLVTNLILNGYSQLHLVVIPWVERKNFQSIFKHRPSKCVNISIEELSDRLRILLGGRIELDDVFFSTERSKNTKESPLKRGRGSQKKSKVIVMAESEKVTPTKKGQNPRRVGYLKMKVAEDLQKETITPLVNSLLASPSSIASDKSNSYVDLHEFVAHHQADIIPSGKVGEKLPWVHIAISNAKRVLLNTYHSIKPEFLQNYLDEFCYKFNRRYRREILFNRLLIASVSYKNEFGHKYR